MSSCCVVLSGFAPRRPPALRSGKPDRQELRSEGTLDPHWSFLIELREQVGDMTMPELAGALADTTSVQAHAVAIGRFLRKFGFNYKKDAGRDGATPYAGSCRLTAPS